MSGVRFLLIITKFMVSELKSTHVRHTAHREYHELLFIFFLDVPVIVIAVNGFINQCLLFLPFLLTIITPSFVIQNIAHLVPIKLDSANFLLWKLLFQPILHNHCLEHFVDGFKTAPLWELIGSDGKSTPKQSFIEWFE